MIKAFLPRDMKELWSILDGEPDARLYAGGTDLLVALRENELRPSALVCIERMTELKGVREASGGLWLGAGMTHTELLHDPLVQRRLPILVRALQTLGSPLIRNMGTIGGNICTASPAGDTLPPLYLLDAELELQSRSASRRIPLAAFITGPGQTRLEKGELLTGVLVKKPAAYNVQHFEKVGQRLALACSIASLAALLKFSATGNIEAALLAWGSVGPTVMRSPEAEAALIGKKLCRDILEKAAAIARQAVSPIDDVRASAVYRREIAGNLLFRLLCL